MSPSAVCCSSLPMRGCSERIRIHQKRLDPSVHSDVVRVCFSKLRGKRVHATHEVGANPPKRVHDIHTLVDEFAVLQHQLKPSHLGGEAVAFRREFSDLGAQVRDPGIGIRQGCLRRSTVVGASLAGYSDLALKVALLDLLLVRYLGRAGRCKKEGAQSERGNP